MRIRIIFGTLAAIAIFLVMLLQWSVHRPLSTQGAEHIVMIAPGTSSEDIGKLLKRDDIIRSRFAFDYYVWKEGIDDTLKAGEYRVSSAMTIPEIARILSGGDAISNDISITIPEGFTIQQVAERLAANGFVDHPETFLNTTVETAPYSFLPSTENRLPISALEGYLFPETYRFDPSATTQAIAGTMLDTFQQRIVDRVADVLQARGLAWHDAVTMASLIEGEVRTAEDRAIVSGILWKRLDIGMPLQVDATVVYVTGKRLLSRDDLQVDSSYNTYRNRGLPPGPINNPGSSAIHAALHPQESSFLYYLSKPNGETVFSRTLEEHNAAKVRYLR